MPDEFATTPPIPYVEIGTQAAAVRTAIDAARLSAANSFGGLQKLAIPGPFATDAEANTFGVPDDNLYYRSDGTVRAASHISLDLAFALDKTLTARTGPTPTFSRASSGLFTNANGILVGKTAGTTASLDPTTTTVGTTQVTVTVASGSVVGWLVGQSISLIVDSNANNAPDTGELWLVGDIVSMTATELVFKVTSKGTTSASATDWTLGYRGARFDHDPATGICKGLLIEESRTNLLLRSEEFDNSAWNSGGFGNLVVTPDSIVSPSGVTNADKLTVGVGTAVYQVIQSIAAVTSGVAYTLSCYVKPDQVTKVRFWAGTAATLPIDAYFDLTGSGSVISSIAGGAASITQISNGWYRIQITATAGASASTSLRFGPSGGSGTTVNGNGEDSFYAWGAQLEAGAFPTSYIPTTIGTAARSADVCSIIGTDFSSFYNQSEGTTLLVGDTLMSSTHTASRAIYSYNNGGYGSTLGVAKAQTGALIAASATGCTPLTQALPTLTSQFKSAVALATNGIVTSCLNTSTADLTGTFTGAAFTRLTFHDATTNGSFWHSGHIARIQYFRKRLSNAKLQTLTAL